MEFVEEIDKTARMKDALTREASLLVVVYGRRRLGTAFKNG